MVAVALEIETAGPAVQNQTGDRRVALAQVAAFADRHVHVRKADDGSVTTSGVRLVEGPDRLEVLAQMMGGLDSSESALAHARELLASTARS